MEAALVGFVEGRVVRDSDLPTADLAIRKMAALEALSRRNDAIDAKWLDSIAIEPNLWPTSAVIDWYLVLKRSPQLPQRDERMKAAEQILRSRLNFQGTTMGFSTEKSDALWWLMVSADSNANRLLLALLDAPAWKEDMPRLVRGSLGRMQRGHWNTTVANAWGVLAMEKFSAAFETDPVTGTTSATLAPERYRPHLDGRRRREAVRQEALLAAAARRSRACARRQRQALDHAAEHRGDSAEGGAVDRLQDLAPSLTAVQQQTKGKWSRGDVARVHLEVEAQSDMTWVVVDDPIPAGSTALGRGLGGDSALLGAGRGQARHGVARIRGAHFHRVSRLLSLRAQGQVRPRVHRAAEQSGRVSSADDARRGDVRPGDVRRAAERGLDGAAVIALPGLPRPAPVAAWALAAHAAHDASLLRRRQGRVRFLGSGAARPPWRAAVRTARRAKVRRLDWVPLADVSPAMAATLIAAEDKRFYDHAGVDWSGLAGAAWDSVWRTLDGRRPRGGSTIAMQLAGLLDPALDAAPASARTFGQKWDQAQAALALERTWTKAQILEAYLNLASYRGELTGLSAAARGLFGKAPAGIDAREAAILVALLRNPNAPPAAVAQRACAVAALASEAIACEEVRATRDGDARRPLPHGAALERCAARRRQAA